MKLSAGILFYRFRNSGLEFFLVHPGGPYWKNKDLGCWSIPKGEYDFNESPEAAARREVLEETGVIVNGELITLTPLKQKSGKLISAWAVHQDFNAAEIKSNLIDLEWPPGSGKYQSFSEVDRGVWLSIEEAKHKISPGQLPWLYELTEILSSDKQITGSGTI